MFYDHIHPSLSSSRKEPITLLGNFTFRGKTQTFGILPKDRLRHMWVIGKTGSGKSTLLSHLLAQDLVRGVGLALLDPHGDLFKQACAHIPKSRTNQTLLFDPTDTNYPISFNILRQGKLAQDAPSLLTSQIISVFKKQWKEFWGPRLEHVLRNAILAVLYHPQATLLLLYRFLTNETLREKTLVLVQDPIVKMFWEDEFANYSRSLKAEATAPVLNKLGAFVSNPILRNIIGQVRTRIDLLDIMDNSKILLANLATGHIGEDASHLLGGLLLSAINLSASSRGESAHKPKACKQGGQARKPFIVYADEFQHFVNDSIATILAESRKYGIGLVLAHQYLNQLPESLQGAVLGNVGSIIAFRLGARDAKVLEDEFLPDFQAQNLSDMPSYHMLVKLLANGKQLNPFLAQSSPPLQIQENRVEIEKLKDQSQKRYARSKQEVEKNIFENF